MMDESDQIDLVMRNKQRFNPFCPCSILYFHVLSYFNRWMRNQPKESSFKLTLLPHSYHGFSY